MPGPEVTGEAELRADIRARGVSNLHPVGTCRMGRKTDAMVAPQMRVHGIAAPRVAGGRRGLWTTTQAPTSKRP